MSASANLAGAAVSAESAQSAQRAQRVLADLAARGASVRRLTADSRAVRPGDCFVAYPGASVDGRRFVGAAIAAGAGAVLWEKTAAKDREAFLWRADWSVPNLEVSGLRPLAGEIASQVYGEPSHRLSVVGVTGTNGKTSTTQWIAQALTHAGRPSAVIGTLGIGALTIGAVDASMSSLAENPNTTPDAIVLQEALAAFVDRGVQAVAMEVSSIGLDQGRVNGTRIGCAVFTNVSRDHLDYHGTMEAYAEAKMRLFDWPSLTHAVINLDDVVGVRIVQQLRGRGVRRIGYSATGIAALIDVEELLVAREIHYEMGGLAFQMVGSAGSIAVRTPFVGVFNVANLLAVAAVLLAQDVPFTDVPALIEALTPVAGRMQRVGGGNDAAMPAVLVDYAHTPDALEKALAAGRELATARGGALVVVFGCGGDRDRGKRPEMGRIAGCLADRVVLTSDNPRGESPADILAQIAPGVAGTKAEAQIVEDRRDAIELAIAEAGARDVVLIAGKGHEPYQEISGVRHPFLDADEATRALRGRSA